METNYAVHPGFYVEEWLDENHHDSGWLAQVTGLEPLESRKLVAGAWFSDEAPRMLGVVTGVSEGFWERSWAKYREDRRRLRGRVRTVGTIDELDQPDMQLVQGIEPSGTGVVYIPAGHWGGQGHWKLPITGYIATSTELFGALLGVTDEPIFTVIDRPEEDS